MRVAGVEGNPLLTFSPCCTACFRDVLDLKILVTGAAGFIGSHVAEALLGRGDEVVSLDSLDPFYDPTLKRQNLDALRAFSGFASVEGDIRDPESWASLPDGVEAVMHLAARAGVRPSIAQPALYADVNVTGTARMLDFAHERSLRGVVFASSSSVYGESDTVPFSESAPADQPVSPYAATKRAGELLCHAAHQVGGLPVVITRLFTVYGPRQRPDLAIHRFTRLLFEGKSLPRFGDGSTARDYTYVADVVAGLIASLDLASGGDPVNETLNLGSDRPITLNELIQVLGEVVGVEPVVEELPLQDGDVSRTWADVSRARSVLGWEARTPFREGVEKFVEWMRRA